MPTPILEAGKDRCVHPHHRPERRCFRGACGERSRGAFADSLPEETVLLTSLQSSLADTQPQEPEAPAEGETGSGDTAGEAPSISLPTQEEVEQAVLSIYNAASSIWGAIQDAASQQN